MLSADNMRLITLLTSAVFLLPHHSTPLKYDAFLGPHESLRAKLSGAKIAESRVIAHAASRATHPGVPAIPSADSTSSKDGLSLTREQASHFAGLALKCVRREYPNKMDHVMNDSADVRGPRALHPAFYGCFDWHSCVHGHWMLARLLRLFPDLKEAQDIRAALYDNPPQANWQTDA